MSRRKQSNPKPLLKSDCQDSVEEIATERESSETDDSREGTNNGDPVDVDMEETSDEISFQTTPPTSNSGCKNEQTTTRQESPPTEQIKEQLEPKLPKVRLNASLASDPALKPDAKDLKTLTCESLLDDLTKREIKNDGVKSPNGTDILQRVKVFLCHPCGIGFSSLSTLEAHQTYYCSHRKDNDEDAQTTNMVVSESISSGEPSTKSIKTGKQYACTQCSYSADKKVSLNRHMRMHQTSPVSTSNMSNGDDNSSQQTDRYCSECDIRFSNIKTYRAHKQHYCHSRRMDNVPATSDAAQKGESNSPTASARATTPLSTLQPFLALPTNPILIIPYSLLRMASFLPGPVASLTGGIENADSTCFTYESGTMRPLAVAISPPNAAPSSSSTSEPSATIAEPHLPNSNGPSPSVLTEKNLKAINPAIFKTLQEDINNRESAPLDLSFRKSPFERPPDGKENLSDRSDKMTPEHIVCAPSLPSSPSLTPSPSKKQTPSPNSLNLPPSPNAAASGKNSPRSISVDIATKIAESNKSLELALKLTSALGNKSDDSSSHAINSALLSLPTNLPLNIVPNITNLSPQIYVKQGVSKCKECNIVFCKYENYLAHKQHYCSARNKDDAEGKSNSSSNIVSQSDTVPPPIAYQQLICAACGIKYTSLDNLRAHQSFYCPKGGGGGGSDLSAQAPTGKDKCTKCKVVHENGQCTFTQGSYKCPVCDVVSLSAMESRKHLETHGSVKAFRCSICGYKGNTLRGMRTHIRMHFDKKPSDFNEESFMSCIMEEDGLEIIAPETVSTDQHLQQQIFNCDNCNYSSSYKGNVIRHMKLVHSQPTLTIASPISLTEKKDTYPQNGDIASKSNDDGPSFGIKIETVDPKTNAIPLLSVDEIPNIKIEIDDDITTSSSSKDIISAATAAAAISSTPPLIADDIPLKYCQPCDIKFKYMNSFLAHKQFYCKSNRNDSDDLSLHPNSTSSTVNKSKESLETVL